MLKTWVGADRDAGKASLTQIGQEVVLGENTHFESASCSSVEYKVRERFGGPLGGIIDEPTLVPVANDLEVVEVREVLDGLGLQAIRTYVLKYI